MWFCPSDCQSPCLTINCKYANVYQIPWPSIRNFRVTLGQKYNFVAIGMYASTIDSGLWFECHTRVVAGLVLAFTTISKFQAELGGCVCGTRHKPACGCLSDKIINFNVMKTYYFLLKHHSKDVADFQNRYAIEFVGKT